ncbi:hypothetical protein BO86DRAFT_97541 [Aspergillus japonicus CBS 114.51]|uniref:Uncharacterized protein n=2 Tax=Aspergillus TaxID=5052 RepID=A0A2V5H4S0_ASPV1|nr:hypothetical protein BO86DRAFT_97541 [Aspergillus japonicus CBS 114.51]PYI18501.1 hypothetical protein BO99DRAFT_163822 [Aspergillus violaceofuscus CBS 115571]RAH81446.1 hypothetical protein BO86DRAFT_97541 [Aspergillus japonicus CBS 114.51]
MIHDLPILPHEPHTPPSPQRASIPQQTTYTKPHENPQLPFNNTPIPLPNLLPHTPHTIYHTVYSRSIPNSPIPPHAPTIPPNSSSHTAPTHIHSSYHRIPQTSPFQNPLSQSPSRVSSSELTSPIVHEFRQDKRDQKGKGGAIEKRRGKNVRRSLIVSKKKFLMEK